MVSIVWTRDPVEAYENPFEHGAQEQFVREADAFLGQSYQLLNSPANKYGVDDRTLEKAIWLLQMDALDSLRDCLRSLTGRRHRIAGKLFRDVLESLDLAAYFHSGTVKSLKSLEKWYDDDLIMHGEYRRHLEESSGKESSDQRKAYHRHFSRFTHRSYRVILDGYCRAGDMLVHDATGLLYGTHEAAETLLTPYETVALYFTTLAGLILFFSEQLFLHGAATEGDVRAILMRTLESETVLPRHFVPRQWFHEWAREFGVSEQGSDIESGLE